MTSPSIDISVLVKWYDTEGRVDMVITISAIIVLGYLAVCFLVSMARTI
ncbi:hypothetical protein LBHL_21860 [Lactobacillus helveticus]|nr:hypothetical protein LBHL_21860 [Lactobacillus helveticus]GFP15693.1 hypothetical protein LHEJCM1120_13220 [Lactobacillus helveticus]